MKRCWRTIVGEVSYLAICALSVIGAVVVMYRLLTEWRQGWMLW